MWKHAQREQGMFVDDKPTLIKTLNQLRILLTQDENGYAEYVFSRLRFGDVWWIPDSISGFGGKERHPWLIVQGYSPKRATVIACPRTTRLKNRHNGVILPAGILPELDKEGLFLLRHRRAFIPDHFRDFVYIGQLPENWIRKTLDFYRAPRESKK